MPSRPQPHVKRQPLRRIRARLVGRGVAAFLGAQVRREAGGLLDRFATTSGGAWRLIIGSWRHDLGVRAGLAALGTRRQATCFYRVDDPHSHLLAQCLPALIDRTGLEVELCLVSDLPPELRPQAALQDAYALRDAGRLARWYAPLEFPREPVWPTPERVRRAQAVLLVERDPRARIDAAIAVGEALWRGDDDALADLARPHDALADTVSPSEIQARLDAGDRRLRATGHYQSATLHCDGSVYWGVDRLHHLEARLRALGRGRERAELSPAPLVYLRPAAERPPVADRADTLVCYLSVRSPYSYIGLERVLPLAERYGVRLDCLF